MKSGKYTLDRFEGNLAVLLFREDESQQITIPREHLRVPVKEGDILEIVFDEFNRIESAVVLEGETEEARRKASELLQKISRKN